MFIVFQRIRKQGMTVSSAFAFIGYLKAKDLAIPHPKLLPGTADFPETL
jgi:hypothetical protein